MADLLKKGWARQGGYLLVFLLSDWNIDKFVLLNWVVCAIIIYAPQRFYAIDDPIAAVSKLCISQISHRI